jgi:hypothetical protein
MIRVEVAASVPLGVTLGPLQQGTPRQEQGVTLATRGLETLRQLAKPPKTSTFIPEEVSTSLLLGPVCSLRDSKAAVEFARYGAELNHRHKPLYLLTLAQGVPRRG